MPFYEYKCLDCGKINEVFVRAKDQRIQCEQCGGANLQKLISTFNVKTAPSAPRCGNGSCDFGPNPGYGCDGCCPGH